jgi:outer membrane protein OmpA-like peptidoglycan-associated protein/opacity protein-like surface antigen
MSFQLKSRPCRVLALMPAVVVLLCSMATLAAAQEPPPPKVELFGGYSFFYPGGDVHGQLPGAIATLDSTLESNHRGAGASITYDFNRWIGLTLDASTHWGSGEMTLAKKIDDVGFSNLSLGPKLTYRSKYLSPFIEVLIGDHRLMPDAFHDVDKFGLMLGGGLDVNLSRHIALRVIRADYIYSDYRYVPPGGLDTQIRGVRLQAGINFMLGGGAAPLPLGAACSAQPNEVFAGEPVTGTATGSNFNPKRTIHYSWSGTGVKVSGANASTQIDTTGLQPGSYSLNASLSDGSKNGVASCMAMFNVKQPRPPVIACSSDPGTIKTGGSATIRSSASSPDGRNLSYSYSASAGNVSGADTTATLNSQGARPGPITVTCNVSDDRNLTASSTTMVTVEAPPPPPPPTPAPRIQELETRLALHSIYFATAQPSASNPNGGLLPSQEQILLTLAQDFVEYLKYKPDAHLILGAHADPRGTEEYNKRLTQRRLTRATDVLVGNGVPADHIDSKSFGKEEQLTADQIKQQIADNPDLSPDDRKQMLGNLTVMVLANNRRIDVSLSTTGQDSTRRYPFNAKDFLALINTKGTEKKPKPAVKKPPVKK